MVQKSQTTTRDISENPVNNGINYQPQLVSLPDFWTINSITWQITTSKPLEILEIFTQGTCE